MDYDLEWIEKSKPFYNKILRGVAKNVSQEGKTIPDNEYLRTGIKDLRIYLFWIKRQIYLDVPPWDDYFDNPWKWKWHDRIIDWANMGDKDAQLYLEVCDMFITAESGIKI